MQREYEGFASFVEQDSRRLQQVAWQLTHDWALAEDLTQIALTKLWRHWSRVAPGARYAYARAAAVTSFLDWRRRRSSGEILSASPEPESISPTQEHETRLDLIRAVGQLPPRQRAVIVLRYFEDLSQADTAAAMGCSVGTVKSHSARAMDALRSSPAIRPAEERTDQ